MKTDNARYAFRGSRIVGDVVSRHPIFIAPDITQQHEHEAGEIEDEFLDWNCSTHCRYLPTECRRLVWENEKALPKSRSSTKPSGVSTAIVLQNAFLGNCKAGRQANHHPSAAMGITNKSRLQVYPSGVGLSEVACKMTG